MTTTTEQEKTLKIYRSSAGSGKTYTLVKEYISILLNSRDPLLFRKILAITFTNKAANEMKERVLETVKELSTGELSNLMQDYTKVTLLSPNQIAKRSQTIFQYILHHYGEFNILTIDKFIHRIIRSFTRELGLAMNFELESDVELFVARSIEMLLSEVGVDKNLTKYLIQFSEHLIENSEKGDVEKKLIRLSQVLQKEEGKEALKELEEVDLSFFIEIQKKVKLKIKKLKIEIEKLAKETISLIEEQGIGVFDLAGGKNGFGKMYIAFSNQKIEQVNVSETMLKRLEDDVWYGKTTKAYIKNTIDSIHTELVDKTTTLVKLYKEYMKQRTFDRNFIGFSLLNSIYKLLQSIKQESNIVFLNDFNEIISNVVQNEPAPFIYEKIGNRYHYFLIDEFQDTSKLQWNNLVPLVYDSLSNGYKNLIVGDAKQAIYRWRGGDVNQFIDLPEVKGEFHDLYAINQTFKHAGKVENLEDNWRSYKSIVEFNNWLFSSWAEQSDAEVIKKIYQGVKQNVKKEKEGLVSYQLLEGDKEELEEIRLDLMLEYIEECKTDGFDYSDIAILVKTNKKGKLVASFLTEKGMSVVSADSIVLSSSAEVQFVIAFFETIINPRNEHAILRCLQYLEKEKHLSEVHEKWRIPNAEKPQYSVSIDFEGFLTEKYPQFEITYFEALNLYDKTVYLYETFELNRFDAYLDQLLNTIQNYTKRNTSSLQEFVAYFEDNKDRIPVNTGGNSEAIQISTIHKSKGLQYPVVIMPFADWKNKNSMFTDYTWIKTEGIIDYDIPRYVVPLSENALKYYNLENIYKKENQEIILDNINVFYVAFTRPEKRMYVIAQKPKENKYRKETIPSVYVQIINLIKTHENYNEEEGRLVLGKREKEEKSKKEKKEATKYKGPNVKTWRNDLALSLDKNALELELKELDEREYGKAVHYIWSNISTPDDLTEAVEKAVVRGILPLYLKNEVERSIAECLQLEQVKTWFELKNAEVLNEMAIVSETGQSYRPDKVILSENQTVVIDYKTGNARKSHQKQIIEYSDLLKEMGYENLKLYLLYMKERKVLEVKK